MADYECFFRPLSKIVVVVVAAAAAAAAEPMSQKAGHYSCP